MKLEVGEAQTPVKLEVPVKQEVPSASTGIKSEYAIPQKAPAIKEHRAAAFFDFSRRVAYMFVEGRRLDSSDWYRARPDKGAKSPMFVNFAVPGPNPSIITAHLHGVWPGALDIGMDLPKHSPVCRLWKASRS